MGHARDVAHEQKTPSPLLALLDRLTELRPRQLCDAPPDEPRLWTQKCLLRRHGCAKPSLRWSRFLMWFFGWICLIAINGELEFLGP